MSTNAVWHGWEPDESTILSRVRGFERYQASFFAVCRNGSRLEVATRPEGGGRHQQQMVGDSPNKPDYRSPLPGEPDKRRRSYREGRELVQCWCGRAFVWVPAGSAVTAAPVACDSGTCMDRPPLSKQRRANKEAAA